MAIAQLTVQRGDVTEYPLATRTRGGWQNGVTFYPNESVTKVVLLRCSAAEGPNETLIAATREANERYRSKLVEDYDGDRYVEDEYGYDSTSRQAFVAGALWLAGVAPAEDQEETRI